MAEEYILVIFTSTIMFLKYSLIIVLIFAKYSLCCSEDPADTQHRRYRFIVKEAPYTRLCDTKPILTVNGQFPGPAIKVHKGETILVDVFNRGKYNITLHWHGVKQLRNPWSDGPEYITQCPIQPGRNFTQKVIFSKEEGTLWWHAHSDWSRATVHGPIIVYPPEGASYPFQKPAGEVPIILGQWWKQEIMQVFDEFIRSGGQPRNSDAYTINGQPGDLYPCSNNDTFTMNVNRGKTYLLRIVNAGMNEILFFGVANHTLTLVGTDGSYTKPLTRDYIVVGPGQTMDCLLQANQSESRYLMAAKPYVSGVGVDFDNSTTTGILRYYNVNTTAAASPLATPNLPAFNDTGAAMAFEYSVRSLDSGEVPQTIDERIVSTISINTFPCAGTGGGTCQGPNGTRLAASMNNISFVNPSISILEAYYYRVAGVFGEGFPGFPPFVFNYTADVIPVGLEVPARGTEVKLVRFGSGLEVVLQGTNLVAGIDHPMHLHGFTFFVVGSGFGNFDPERDPAGYNLVDPQRRNTIIVPKNGWVAIRFTADNPGTWFMHCHFERHLTWGMDTVFIVGSGGGPAESVLPPPRDMPPC